MAFYTQAWFWLIIVAIILFIVAVIGYEINRTTTVPMWVWAVFFLSIALFLVAILVYAFTDTSVTSIPIPAMTPTYPPGMLQAAPPSLCPPGVPQAAPSSLYPSGMPQPLYPNVNQIPCSPGMPQQIPPWYQSYMPGKTNYEMMPSLYPKFTQ